MMYHVGPWEIEGEDFDRAGAATAELKKILQKAGADAERVRCAVIAAYEAETNVVVHARRGRIHATLAPDRIDIEVSDEGPGIADVALAMKEGFSTASEKARAMGFGAGMGLPNIRRNSDNLQIDTAVGRGTRLSFAVFLKPWSAGDRKTARGLRISGQEQCGACRKCLFACPMGALRLRHGRPSVLEERCIDCAECMRVCEKGSFAVDWTAPRPRSEALLAAPAAFFTRVGYADSPRRTAEAMRGIAGRGGRVIEDWAMALVRAGSALAASGAAPVPVIVPVCPAAVRFIAARFPALLRHVPPLASPVEAARAAAGGGSLMIVAFCPGQAADAAAAGAEVVRPDAIAEALAPALHGNGGAPATEDRVPDMSGQDVLITSWRDPYPFLAMTGLRDVAEVLERLEKGRYGGPPVLELYACEHGCFGSPLAAVSAFDAHTQWMLASEGLAKPAGTAQAAAPVEQRPALRLDPDMATAIEKLSRIDALTRTLSGRDCGLCGAPGCAAMAEDMVLGRTVLKDCPGRSETAKKV
jgi:serine/threonine-protein kinase RsbT